jgi:serine/threonine protein kinase/tetratricopeptide (TPR) repeat protein
MDRPGPERIETADGSIRASPQPPPIPDHELLHRIGSGSYGEVWLARNALGVYRAVKIVHRCTFEHERPFEREFRGIQKFEPVSRSHEGLVDLLQVGRNDQEGWFYYVMELADDASVNPKTEIRDPKEARNPKAEIDASPSAIRPSGFGFPSEFGLRNSDLYAPRTLRSEIQRRGRLPFDECVTLGVSLAHALAHLHAQGLVHRDIKPSNIIFVGGVPKLADIGLVTDVGEARSYVGTEGFIPPEGPGTPAADLFSLGKVLYEASTGKDRQDFPEPLTNLGEQPNKEHLLELNAIIHRACQSGPHVRYQSADEMLAELELLQRGESVKHKRVLERRWAVAMKFSITAAALALLFAGGWFLINHLNRSTLLHSNASVEVNSIAVLPFDNESPEKTDEYLGAQMAGELTSALARVPDLRVLGQHTGAALKATKNLRATAQTLDLRAVLTGSVRKSGQRLRVSAHLINPVSDALLWSEVYDGDTKDIFGMETEIVERIADRLGMKLSESARQRLALKATKNFDAFQAYLEGRFQWNIRSLQGLTNSVALFERALALDTNYALAWAALGDAWNSLGDRGVGSPAECGPEAKECAQRAVRLDAMLAEAHAALAKATHIFDWDRATAEKQFQQAITLNPNYASAHQWYAELLSWSGRHDAALTEMRRAMELDPFSPIINCNLGMVLYNARRFPEAIAELTQATERVPGSFLVHEMLGDAYWEIGKGPEAISEWLRARSLSGESAETIAEFRRAAAASGAKGYWQKALERQLGKAKQGYVRPSFLAGHYARLGETNQALDWLEKACAEKSPMFYIKVMPIYDILRSEPRFIEVLKKVEGEK